MQGKSLVSSLSRGKAKESGKAWTRALGALVEDLQNFPSLDWWSSQNTVHIYVGKKKLTNVDAIVQHAGVQLGSYWKYIGKLHAQVALMCEIKIAPTNTWNNMWSNEEMHSILAKDHKLIRLILEEVEIIAKVRWQRGRGITVEFTLLKRNKSVCILALWIRECLKIISS